jgi:hypothetical protein
VGNDRVELEPEDAWLRYRLRRFRAIFHRMKDPEARTFLQELMDDAEHRLDLFEKMRARETLK